MANNNEQAAPPIAPPLLIGLCILGAVIVVIVTAALYKLCRRATVDVDQEAGESTWNPNQRSVEQSRYMEEVRLRNKMFAWERSRAGIREGNEQNWFEKRCKGKEILTEEYLEEVPLDDNPYEELVDDCVKRQSHQFPKPSPKRPWSQPMRPKEFLPGDFRMPDPHTYMPPDTNWSKPNDSGIKITFNDEENDVADLAGGYDTISGPRRSRMFRSSSIYSGDALLPSTHLHMVHSSSTYALGKIGLPNQTRES